VDQVMHDSPETKAIRRRMEAIRCDLDEDVQDFIEDARDMGKWRYYVRTYPWICLGAALAGGYLIVPRRVLGVQPDAPTPAEFAAESRLPVTPNAPPQGGVRGALLTFVGNLVMRNVLSFVGQQAGRLFAQPVAGSKRKGVPHE
jgi:hypothetical protein